MNNIVFYALLLLLGSIVISCFKKDTTSVDLAVNVVATAGILLLEKILINFNMIWLWLITNTWYRKKRIRLSISYLFKIKVNDKYLLVKGKRINQFQPVGGVYKRYRESYYKLQSMKVTDDDNIPIDDESMDDLRIKVPATNVVPLLRWFNSQRGREVSPYREFHEELIRTGILSYKNFPYLNYLHNGRHTSPLHFSPHFQCYEILIAEIFELRPNPEQEDELKLLLTKASADYCWANEDLIQRLGVIPGMNSNIPISETAKWIL